jgi:hypothetical protein
MWKNTVEPNGPQMKLRRMRIAWWIPKATNTISEYVILIDFPLNSVFTNAPQCYVERTCILPVLFFLSTSQVNIYLASSTAGVMLIIYRRT